MLPLYAIGVMISFTLTGLGLARHTWQTKEGNWKSDFTIFGFGGLLSFFILGVFVVTKFSQGAWVVLIIIPALVLFFDRINVIYKREIASTMITPEALDDFHQVVAKVKKRRAHMSIDEYRNKFVIPVYDLNLIVLKACKYAYSLTPQVTAVHVASDPIRTEKLLRHWAESKMEIPLEIVQSPYRATVHDFIAYVTELEKNTHFTSITVVVPEFVPDKLWHNALHNQTGQLLKLLLLLRKNILITSVPYHPEIDKVKK